MELLNQPLNVEFASLTAPPKGADRLATKGQLLVVWSEFSYVLDPENGERYHLAFYRPACGWCACRWDEECGPPYEAHLVSESAILVIAKGSKLIHIFAEDEVSATILAFAKNRFSLLYTSADNLWIQVGSAAVVQLRLQKEGLTIVNKKWIPFYVQSMYPLVDGAWMMRRGDGDGYVIQSSSFEETIHETQSKVSLHPPFIVRAGHKHRYYTEDPRCGWKKIPISIENRRDKILFFAKHDDIYYVAVYRDKANKTLLYRLSGESKTDAEYMWEISGYFLPDQFAMYNGLVCVAENIPLVISGREDVPENHGFLIWNPRSNTFHEDIPQSSIMHARIITPHKLQIPIAWSDRSKRQDIQDAISAA